jgi:hypothetical protein
VSGPGIRVFEIAGLEYDLPDSHSPFKYKALLNGGVAMRRIRGSGL